MHLNLNLTALITLSLLLLTSMLVCMSNIGSIWNGMVFRSNGSSQLNILDRSREGNEENHIETISEEEKD
uniref:Uncharacterized protein n=1 Tax=Pristionchus pacificus TaxID=54126 RepID=A0A2A6BDU6_PRIPA|eukprot:PDM64026.1 hypothetical protein PRIPAC_54270 [Pristionchus pacificus]